MPELTPLERCLRALRLQKPDRIPVIPQAHIWTLYRYGSSSTDCMHNGSLYAELQIKAQQEFGWDGVIVATDSVALADSLGTLVEMTELGPVPGTRGVLESLREIESLKLPDPRETRLNEWIVATRTLVREIGDRVLILARADQGPFSLSCQVRGMEAFMTELGIGEHPEEIHRLLNISTEYVWRFAELLLEAGAHVVSIGDALASGSVVSPKTFEEYAFPYQQELARRVRSKGGMLSIHVCGQTGSVMSRLAQTGAHLLEFDAPTDFDSARKAANGRVCLMGNVDTSEVLTFGDEDLVKETCRTLIGKVKPESGFILSSGCALSPNTPAENIMAMIEAARAYGVY